MLRETFLLVIYEGLIFYDYKFANACNSLRHIASMPLSTWIKPAMLKNYFRYIWDKRYKKKKFVSLIILARLYLSIIPDRRLQREDQDQ